MLRGTGACLVSRARLQSQRSEALGGVASICMGSGAALGGVGVGRQRVRFTRRSPGGWRRLEAESRKL